MSTAPIDKRIMRVSNCLKTTRLHAAAITSLCCLFHENEFSMQGARSHSCLALTIIKSRDWRPRFVTTCGMMHGRIQRLLGEICCEWCQKLCRLSTVPCKPPPSGKKLPPTWVETRSKAEGSSLTAPPPSRRTWADAFIMRAPTVPSWNKLTSPVKP
jgi:hypothetical protein